MLSAACLFRNDWMNKLGAMSLLEEWCAVPELVPQYWNWHEPINKPFSETNLLEYANGLGSPSLGMVRTSILFKRKAPIPFWGDITLIHRPVHNDTYVSIDKLWVAGEFKLSQFIGNFARKTHADYGYVANADKEDVQRFKELQRPYTAEEIRLNIRRGTPFIPERAKDGTTQYWFLPSKEEMYGPDGFIWDIVWFNYFGPPYVDLIGKKRLRSAGWTRIDEIEGGLGCYVTENIQDPGLREKRERIRGNLEEFVWTPGCKHEDKRAPVFDFSQQILQKS